MYKLDDNGADLIISFEKIRYKAYPDRAGHSIGAGHYILPGEEWLLTATLTHAQVVWLFKKDMLNFEKEFNRVFGKLKLNQNQVNALFDVLYNCGLTKLLASGMMTALRSGDKDKITECFLKLDKGSEAIRARRMVDIMIFFQEEPFHSSQLDSLKL